MLLVSTTDQAWTNIIAHYTLNQHKTRRLDLEFDGRKFIHTIHPQSAKGVTAYLMQFLFDPNPQFFSNHYSFTAPFPIKPENFIDCRDWQLDEYEAVGYPGHKLRPEVLLAARRFGVEATYTNWSNGDATRQHRLSLDPTPQLLSCVEAIVDYWHMSSANRLPTTQKEKVGILLNALGLGYLYHPLLPIPNNPGFGFTSDPPPANYPPQPTWTLPGLTMRNPPIKHRTPIKVCSFCKHAPTTHYLVIGDIKQRTCEPCVDKYTWFLPKGSWSLEPIADFDTNTTVQCKMCPNPATKLHNDFTPLCDSCATFMVEHTTNAIITPLPTN